MLITPEYLKQQKKLHEEGAYGFKGHHYAKQVAALCGYLGTSDVLDYGCGHQTLQKSLGFPIKQYDPCRPGFDAKPEPADIVVCTDVLEHIEPDCLDEVLDDLQRLVLGVGFFAVDTRPARKFLEDGRNAHLIQEPASWWFPKLYARFASVKNDDILFNSQSTPGLIKSLGFVAIVSKPR